MDSDGQHNPEDIFKLLDAMEDYDMVVGSRENSSSVPIRRRPGKKVLQWVLNYFVQEKIPDINSGLRMMKRETILKYMHLCSNKFSFSMSSTILFLSERRFLRFVPIVCRPRANSGSQVGFFDGMRALMTLLRINVMFHPFRFFMPLSAAIGSVGFAWLIYDVIHVNITDFTLLALIVSLIIFLFGLISDQIAQLRRELR